MSKQPQPNAPAAEPLPSIAAESPQQNFAQSSDPAKIAEQLRHAQEQLELQRRYPGRERGFRKGKV